MTAISTGGKTHLLSDKPYQYKENSSRGWAAFVSVFFPIDKFSPHLQITIDHRQIKYSLSRLFFVPFDCFSVLMTI